MNTKVSNRIVLGVVAAVAMFAASAAQAERIQIFSGSSPIFGPAFVADAKGFFEDEGLDVNVKPFTSGAAATEGFRSGGAQFLVASDVPHIYLLTGDDAVMLAQFSQNPDMLLVVGEKGMSKPADFKGKKVGMVRKSASEYLFEQFMRTGGLHADDAELVNLAPFDQVPAIVQKNVEALSTWKPFDKKMMAMAGDRIEAIAWPEKVGYTLYSGIVVSRDYLESADRSEVMAIMRALKSATEWMSNASLDEVSQVVADYLKTSKEDVAHVIRNNTWDMFSDQRFRDQLKSIEDFLYERQFISKRVNWDTAADWSYLEDLDANLVSGLQ